jgi:predicted Rdx family selenoprotein
MHTNRVHGNMGPGHNKITRSPQMVCTICDTSIHRGNMARHMLTHKIPTNGSKPVVASATIAPHASQQFTIKVDDEGVWLKVTSQELASIFGGDQWQTT